MIQKPKLTGREFKKVDLWGWFMCALEAFLMCSFGGIFGSTPNWWMFAATFFVFWDYSIRVAFGRVYKFVYYDTILHPMYEIKMVADGELYYVNAENEDELALYMHLHYTGLSYKIIRELHTETFIRTDEFV